MEKEFPLTLHVGLRGVVVLRRDPVIDGTFILSSFEAWLQQRRDGGAE